MRTIETTVIVGSDRKLTVQLPADVSAGVHKVVLVIDDQAPYGSKPSVWSFPVIDVGPWPEGLSLRREDMYGDDGR